MVALQRNVKATAKIIYFILCAADRGPLDALSRYHRAERVAQLTAKWFKKEYGAHFVKDINDFVWAKTDIKNR